MSPSPPAADPALARPDEDRLGGILAAAFRGTGSPMVVTDPRLPDNPIVFANDAFLALTGYASDEIVGRNCRLLQGPGTNRNDVRRIGEALAEGRGLTLEILNYTKAGRPFWNALVISPVRDDTGALTHFFASQSDVSDKKRVELELTGAKEGLEAEVRRRTEDLEAALEQRTALLHEVDHRVKNSLQVISSLMLLKARRIADEGARHALHNMAERIGALSTVHRLLYSDGDVGRFDFRCFMNDLSADLKAAVPPGQIDFELDVAPVTVPASKAAPLALICNELMTNAIRHAFPDGRRGRIRVGAAPSDGIVRIVVADDGIGLGGTPTSGAFGRTLVDMLVRQLRGGVEWQDAAPGTRAVVHVPLRAEAHA